MNKINSKKNKSGGRESKNDLIAVSAIDESPFQPRLDMDQDKLQELANSIKEDGLIQPVPVVKEKNGRYTLIAGHRRLAAHKMLSLEKIKVTVLEKTDEKKIAASALIENIQRENLNLIELALQYQHLLNNSVFSSISELSKKIGKSRADVGKVLKALSLPDAIIEDVKNNKTTKDVKILDAIGKLPNEEEMITVYNWFKETKASRAEVVENVKERIKPNKDNYESKIYNRLNTIKKIDLSGISKKNQKEIESLLDKIITLL